MDRMNCKHQGSEHGENCGNPEPAVQRDEQRRTDHGIEQMRDAEWQPIERLALVGQSTIHEPSGGGDRVKVREVRLCPNGGEPGK